MSKMANFVKIFMTDGKTHILGSLPNERLDIGFSGGFMTVGRGNTCQFKEYMNDVKKIIFINNFEGPDLEFNVKTLSLEERQNFLRDNQ